MGPPAHVVTVSLGGCQPAVHSSGPLHVASGNNLPLLCVLEPYTFSAALTHDFRFLP